MTWRFQFSLRTVLLALTLVAISLAAIVQVPHIFIFSVGSLLAGGLTWVAYRSVKRTRWWIMPVAAAVMAWIAVYVLSLGPFIALSEIDRKITGQFHLGRLASAYQPIVIRLNNYQSFRWYTSQWIPAGAEGLQALSPNKSSPALLGTWKGEWGQLINFRSNGTARANLLDSRIGYFEWECDGSQLTDFQFGSKGSVVAWFGRRLLNKAWTKGWKVDEISAGHFQLSDANGKTIKFIRTQDAELESVP